MPEMGQEKKSRNTQKFPKNWSPKNIHTSEYSNDKKLVQQNHMGGHWGEKKKKTRRPKGRYIWALPTQPGLCLARTQGHLEGTGVVEWENALTDLTIEL